jgi:hypothetical protein
MAIQDVIDRVRKLRKLATSSNVHEAATAAAIADKLIQEHRLEEAAIEGDEHLDVTIEEDPEFLDLGPRVNSWQWYLYTRLIAHYDVAGYASYRGGHRTLHMIGRKDDIEIARFQCAFYATEINRLAVVVAGGQGRSALNSFRLGCVRGILESIAEAKRAAMANASQSTAMVLADRKKEADEALNKKFPNMRAAAEPQANARDAAMFYQGIKAGKNMTPPKKELGE